MLGGFIVHAHAKGGKIVVLRLPPQRWAGLTARAPEPFGLHRRHPAGDTDTNITYTTRDSERSTHSGDTVVHREHAKHASASEMSDPKCPIRPCGGWVGDPRRVAGEESGLCSLAPRKGPPQPRSGSRLVHGKDLPPPGLHASLYSLPPPSDLRRVRPQGRPSGKGGAKERHGKK